MKRNSLFTGSRNDIFAGLADGRLTVADAIKMLVVINKMEVAVSWIEMKF